MATPSARAPNAVTASTPRVGLAADAGTACRQGHEGAFAKGYRPARPEKRARPKDDVRTILSTVEIDTGNETAGLEIFELDDFELARARFAELSVGQKF